MTTLQQEIYWIISNIKTIINLLALIYQKKKKNANNPKQINYTGKLEEDDDVTIFFIAEMRRKAILNFPLDSLIERK